MDTFPHKDCGLDNDPSRDWKSVRLRKIGVIWSLRRAPDTIRAVVFGVDCSRFIRAHLHVEASSCCRHLSVCLSVCLSVRLSNACIVTKLNKYLPTFLYRMKGQCI